MPEDFGSLCPPPDLPPPPLDLPPLGAEREEPEELRGGGGEYLGALWLSGGGEYLGALWPSDGREEEGGALLSDPRVSGCCRGVTIGRCNSSGGLLPPFSPRLDWESFARVPLFEAGVG